MKKIILNLFVFIAATTATAQDISGTYYVGEPNYPASQDHPWKRTFSQAEITYDPSKVRIDLSIEGITTAMYGTPHVTVVQHVKDGEFYTFNMNNLGDAAIANTVLVQIEPGIFVVNPASTIDIECTEIKRPQKSNAPSKGGKVYPVESLAREFILGKDKARIAQLCSNKEEYEKLIANATTTICQAKNETLGAAHPIPGEGMTDAGLKADVHTQIQKWAIAKSWTQTVERSFIKSTEWNPIKQGARILGREIVCVVIYSKNGVCLWREFLVRQDYNGSAYGQSYVYGELPGGYTTPCN